MLASSPLPAPLPDRLGRFQIVRRLGAGAQSVVYLAFDPQLQREVALKALQGTADTAAALLNEARAVSRLSHAAIIPVFEAVQAVPGYNGDDVGAYLVFEYVPGPTLAEVLRQKGAMPAADAVALLLPVLDAVAYAHASGVIHRDLKPSNILLDRRGMARVMDFGIAVLQVNGMGGRGDTRIANAPGFATNHLANDTTAGLYALVGTPAYMAPEYAQHGRVSAQMDVFSAGLVLFEMLVGQRAVVGDKGLQAIHFLVNVDIRLPPVLRYPVGPRLRDILGHALARDPALRYARMVDFVSALQAWAMAEPVSEPGEVKGAAILGPTAAIARLDGAHAAALEVLLRRIRLQSELPALAPSLVVINRLAASEQPNLDALSAAVLSDVAVTQKLLRMVNSSMYRGFGGGVVTTVSRAIQLLGTAAVRTAAASLPLFGPCKDTQVARLLDDMALAHFSGTVARELSGLWGLEAEEAFVCGCFHRLGRMLLSCHFPAEAAEIERLSTGQPEPSHPVERQVIGLDYEALGRGVAKHWGLPDVVVHSMRAVAHPVATPVGHPEVLRTLSALATELARAWMMPIPEHRHTATTLAAHGYAKALGVTAAKINAAVAAAAQSTQSLLQSLAQDLRYSEVACRLGLVAVRPVVAHEGAPAGEVLIPAATVQHESADDAALATEVARTECQELLAAGVQALSGRLLESFKLNTLVLEVLTTLQRAAGFRQVIFCVREAKTYALVGRIAVGASPSGDTDPGRLHIAMDDPSDPFAAAVFKGDDLWLPDLPAHALNLCKVQGTLGMLLLPLQLKGQPLGLIYADFGAEQAVPIARLGSKELALMGTLRNQVVLAFRQR